MGSRGTRVEALQDNGILKSDIVQDAADQSSTSSHSASAVSSSEE